VIFELGQGFDRWRRQCTSRLNEDSAVHTFCSEGLAVGDKGDNVIIARLIDVSGGQRGSATPNRGACSCTETGRFREGAAYDLYVVL
jgi:hypothetical protein